LFVLAGPETEGFRREYKPKAEANRRVISFGSVSEREKLSLLSACDLLVLPSTVESFGIVYLEAWMYGKPVIGALTEVSSEVITHGKDGLLVPPGDHRALARAIGRLVTRPDLGKRMGARGRRKVLARFTPEVVNGVFEEALLHAVGKGRGR
jgi:glycosyltransferase involved in cell wall biosynthesis